MSDIMERLESETDYIAERGSSGRCGGDGGYHFELMLDALVEITRLRAQHEALMAAARTLERCAGPSKYCYGCQLAQDGLDALRAAGVDLEADLPTAEDVRGILK